MNARSTANAPARFGEPEPFPREMDVQASDQPLTEQILSRLGRRRWPWIVAWAAVPLLRPYALEAGHHLSDGQAAHGGVDLLVPQAVQAYAVLLVLWGIGHLTTSFRTIPVSRAGALPERRGAGAIRIGSRLGPVALTGAIVVVEAVSETISHGLIVAIIDAPLMVLNVLPLATFLWTFLAVLVALDQLGRSQLVLDPFPQDRTLGLRSVGSLAFTGFWLVLATALPMIALSGREVGTLAIGVAAVAICVAALFAAMWGIHRQMTAAKSHYREITRRAFAEAYAPFRARPELDVLAAQANVLRAAQALDERAEHIYEWPIDERTAQRMAIVVTGVITGLIVRSVFAAMGL